MKIKSHRYLQKYEKLKVRTGARRAGVVEITDGLGLGDRIIVDGTGKVRPGQTVVATPDTERMPASKGQADVVAPVAEGTVR